MNQIISWISSQTELSESYAGVLLGAGVIATIIYLVVLVSGCRSIALSEGQDPDDKMFVFIWCLLFGIVLAPVVAAVLLIYWIGRAPYQWSIKQLGFDEVK